MSTYLWRRVSHLLSLPLLKCVAAAVACLSPIAARADVKLPSIFGNHMVLQQGARLPVWGKADPGEEVSVSIGDRQGSAKADAAGRWKIDLQPLVNASKPLVVTVKGTHNTVTFTDVLVGDVWLCSGQSNMGFTVGNLHDAETVAAGADDPQLRYYRSGHQIVGTPQDDCPGEWVVVSPATVRKCSAVSYFMARDLQASGHGPIGLIVVTWGGLPGQSFLSLDALKSDPSLKLYVDELNSTPLPAAPVTKEDPNADGVYREDARPPKTPTLVYNAMIHPLIPYALKGIVWFHGASNSKSESIARTYRNLVVALIRDWRQRWGQGAIPFIIEQINPTGDNLYRPFVRNSQLLAAAEPNTGLSVSIDIGDKDEAHFQDKFDIGARLSLAARQLAYGEEVVGFGPIYQGVQPEGGKLRVTFSNVGSGLKIGVPPPKATGGVSLPMPNQLSDFEIAGPDGKFVPAQAKIDADTVLVWNDTVSDPRAVRYAWAAFPQPLANLYNKEGLPASPFASDVR